MGERFRVADHHLVAGGLELIADFLRFVLADVVVHVGELVVPVVNLDGHLDAVRRPFLRQLLRSGMQNERRSFFRVFDERGEFFVLLHDLGLVSEVAEGLALRFVEDEAALFCLLVFGQLQDTVFVCEVGVVLVRNRGVTDRGLAVGFRGSDEVVVIDVPSDVCARNSGCADQFTVEVDEVLVVLPAIRLEEFVLDRTDGRSLGVFWDFVEVEFYVVVLALDADIYLDATLDFDILGDRIAVFVLERVAVLVALLDRAREFDGVVVSGFGDEFRRKG